MKFRYALTILAVIFYSNIVNAQNFLNKIGLNSTSASVAYSLRQLSTSYTGPLVRIQVGSSFYDVYPDATTYNFSLSSKISAPISTYNAAVSTASTNALSTIITAGTTNATVAIWYDQSTNGIHVYSSSSTAKIITLGSIITINGQPTISFSVGSTLTSSGTVNYSSQTQATINAVAQNINSNNTDWAGIISSGTLGGWGISYNPNTNSQRSYGSGGYTNTYVYGYYVDASGAQNASSNQLTTIPSIITGVVDKTARTSSIYINSVLKDSNPATFVNPTNNPSSKIFIGQRGDISARIFIGNISETFIFDKSLTASEQSALELSQAIFLPPTVTITSSASGAVCAGTNVTFTSTVTGTTSPTYQWAKNGIIIPGANSSTYSTNTLSNNDQINLWINGGINNANIVSNGLLLNLDASNPKSYTGSGATWYDLSGNNNHASLMNNPAYDATSGSIITNGNGSNQYIAVPQISSATTNITMQAWVYVNLNTTGTFIKSGTNGLGYSIGIGNGAYDQVGSNVVMLLYGRGWIGTGVSYGTAGWKLVTFTLDGSSTARAYVNGSMIGTSYTWPTPTAPVGALNFGANIGDGNIYYNGKFAAAYFYNRALSLTEIQQNYNAFATKSTAYNSNTITVSVTGVTSTISVTGEACNNKATLTTTTGLTSYVWLKDNVPISGATTNTYAPSTSGDYQVQVSNGTCTNISAITTIYNCVVNSNGKLVAGSNANASSIVSPEGGKNFGTGRDISGKLINTIGLTTTSGTIGSTSAIIGGIISPTNAVTTRIGVIYSTDINFGTSSTTTIQSNVPAGTYTTTISGLAPLTTYFAKSFIENGAGISYGSIFSFTTAAVPIAVGDSYGGGVVIYVAGPSDPGYDANTTHGLIAAKVDLGSMNWNNGSTAATSNNYFGAGIGNTSIIVAQSGSNSGTNYAAKACDDYTVTETVGGVTTTYTDWYLGSTFENLKMLQNPALSYLTGLANGYYWASNEQTGSGPASSGVAVGSALYVRKTDGYIDQWNKTNGSGIMGVRAIRKF